MIPEALWSLWDASRPLQTFKNCQTWGPLGPKGAQGGPRGPKATQRARWALFARFGLYMQTPDQPLYAASYHTLE